MGPYYAFRGSAAWAPAWKFIRRIMHDDVRHAESPSRALQSRDLTRSLTRRGHRHARRPKVPKVTFSTFEMEALWNSLLEAKWDPMDPQRNLKNR